MKICLIRHAESEANAASDLDNPTYYYDANACNDPAIREMQKELYSRLIKPFFLPVLTLSLCILLLYSKENSNYKNSRIWIFLLGISIIIFTEFSESITARNFSYFKISIIMPLIIFSIQYFFLNKKMNKFN